MKYYKYQLIDYFDVLGNSEDGYEVNNLSREFEVILPYDSTIEDVINTLISKGYFTPLATRWTVEAWDDGEIIELYQVEDGFPLCRLEYIEEVEQNE